MSAMTQNEKSREEFVNEFCTKWSSRNVEELIPYLADDIEYHVFEGGGFVINGHDQFREQMAAFMGGMKEVRWEILRSHTMGDLVINERIDYFIQPNGENFMNSPFHVVGVFLVRDGKIQYWKDYNLVNQD